MVQILYFKINFMIQTVQHFTLSFLLNFNSNFKFFMVSMRDNKTTKYIHFLFISIANIIDMMTLNPKITLIYFLFLIRLNNKFMYYYRYKKSNNFIIFTMRLLVIY